MFALAISSDSPNRLKLSEIDEPKFCENEALVSVHATSLNRGELRLLSIRPDGWIPGQDIVGIVERAAADGSGPPVGSRVVALVDEAGWAERVAVSTDRLAIVPDNVSFASAATLPVAGTTALRTLRHSGDLAGQQVLITGASGAVGSAQASDWKACLEPETPSSAHQRGTVEMLAWRTISSPLAPEMNLVATAVPG